MGENKRTQNLRPETYGEENVWETYAELQNAGATGLSQISRYRDFMWGLKLFSEGWK
jgi:hypothetical protein